MTWARGISSNQNLLHLLRRFQLSIKAEDNINSRVVTRRITRKSQFTIAYKMIVSRIRHESGYSTGNSPVLRLLFVLRIDSVHAVQNHG